MNSILLEAVWKALLVYFYHARLKNVTLVDVCHPVVQVSGAADQDVEYSLSGEEVMPLEKTLHFHGHLKNTSYFALLFLHSCI